jgi:glyoxylase-like metal-dependent hydrolase (beta-lactamase superfamily II)
MNVAVQGTNDRLLAGRPPLQEFDIPRDADKKFEGVIDIFGDGTLFAIHSPGHTTGHIALVARTPAGPVLMTGDVCHTRWGWDNGVEPGTFLKERDPSRKSLFALKALSERHPNMEVKLGHQL